jgi:hypothetical protein
VSYGYDDASRLTSLTRGTKVFGFGYDTVNRRTSMSYPNAVTTSYAYDDLNRPSLGAPLNGTTPITRSIHLRRGGEPSDEGHASSRRATATIPSTG